MTYEQNEKEKEELAFAYAEIVRLMKDNLDDDKIIQNRVKVEMNKFLEYILKDICFRLNQYPYTTISYDMLKECIHPYVNIKRTNQEKERLLAHLSVIKADCDSMAADIEQTFIE